MYCKRPFSVGPETVFGGIPTGSTGSKNLDLLGFRRTVFERTPPFFEETRVGRSYWSGSPAHTPPHPLSLPVSVQKGWSVRVRRTRTHPLSSHPPRIVFLYYGLPGSSTGYRRSPVSTRPSWSVTEVECHQVPGVNSEGTGQNRSLSLVCKCFTNQ